MRLNGDRRLAGALAGVVIAAAAATAVLTAQAPPTPQFRTDVDLVVTEATVVGKDGKPVTGLGPGDFTAEIGGKGRTVVSAEYVDYANIKPGELQPDLDITTNQDEITGRTIILVVDQISLKPESRAVLEAAKRWITSLGPRDRVGVVALPQPGVNVEPTTDHARVAEALSRITPIGSLAPPFSQYNISIWEAFRIKELDIAVRDDVVQRECKGDPRCGDEIDLYSVTLAHDAQAHVQPVLQSFRGLMRGLRAVPGPKHVVLITAGWPISDREAGAEVTLTATDAASSNVIVHTFTAERWALSAFRSRAPVVTNGVQDKTLLLNSVEMMSGITGGQSVRLNGDGAQALAALGAGIGGYYRVAIKGEPDDFDGKPRKIGLKISRPGASLSAYRRLVPGATATAPASTPAAALTDALRSTTRLTAVALRATSYVLQPDETDPETMRIVVVGDISRGKAGPATAVAALYDLDGKPITAVERPVALPADGAEPLTVSLRAPAAPYILRLVVRDADGRMGSLDRPVDARWKRTGEIDTTGLVVFTADQPGGVPAPLFRAVTTAEYLVAQVPFKGTPASPPQVTFEVRGDGAALVSRKARMGKSATGAMVAEDTIPASLFPPGRYTLSATIRPGTARPFLRGFVVEAAASAAPPAPSAAGASPGPPAAAPPSVTPLTQARPARFSTAAVLDPAFVGPLIDQLAARPDAAGVRDGLVRAKAGPWSTDTATGALAAAPIAAQFVAGLGHLQKGQLDAAATAFREALRTAPDFAPALTFLGACYAAGERDREAAGAWQMALVRDPSSPALARLAIEAWLRAGRPAAATPLVTQARTRWPDDPAFVHLQIQTAIADGRAREGVELALTLKDPDGPTLLAAIAALYDASRRQAPVWDAARDLEAMRMLRDRYAATKGESLGLVDVWLGDAARGRSRAPQP